MVSDLFNRMVKSCHAKCVDRKYLDPTLNNGEGKCADRCGTPRHALSLIALRVLTSTLAVTKYFEANELIGLRLQAQGQAMQTQQAQPEKKGWFS